jgi:ankyrin repeat protein
VENDDYDMVKALLDSGADVNYTGYTGYTALCFVKSRKIAELLVKRGTNLEAKCIQQSTAL